MGRAGTPEKHGSLWALGSSTTQRCCSPLIQGLHPKGKLTTSSFPTATHRDPLFPFLFFFFFYYYYIYFIYFFFPLFWVFSSFPTGLTHRWRDTQLPEANMNGWLDPRPYSFFL